MTDAAAAPPPHASPKPPKKRLPLWALLAGGLAGVIALVFLGLIALLVFFPKEAAIAEVKRQVETATHRQVTIGEDVSFTLWPALGFTAHDVALSNPEGFPEAPFISADRVVFAVALMPLLSGDLQVRRLYLEKPHLALIAVADGHGNWEFPATENQQPLQSLKLEDLRLDDGLLTFQGAQGDPMTLEHINAALAIASLDTPVEASGDFVYRGQKLDFTSTIGAPRNVLEQKSTPLTVNITSPVLEAVFEGAADCKTGALEGQLNAHGASARAISAWQGSPLPPGAGFAAWSAQGHQTHEADTIRQPGARLALAANRAAGDLTIVTSPAGRMAISGALSAPTLDLNPYLPAPPARGPGVEVDTAWSTDPIDLSGLRAADANLNLSIGLLKFQKLEFQNARLALGVRNGVADAKLTRISLYSGAGEGRLVADGRQRGARIAVQLDVQNVEALSLLQAAIGLDKLEGRGRLRTSLAGQGLSQSAIMRTLQGTASLALENGNWKGVNLGQMANVLQRLRGQTTSAQGAGTQFSSMTATFQVADGVAATQDLRIVTPLAPISGTGLINIGAQTFDLRLSAQGVGVPFRASGPWARPQFGIDTAAAGDLLRAQVQEQARKALSRNNLGDLGALLGLGPATPAAAPAPSAETETPAATDGATPAEAPAAEKQRTPEERARDALQNLFNRH
ncbi:MAG: AsmA family protein [Hyphomonadaceae bacterium]